MGGVVKGGVVIGGVVIGGVVLGSIVVEPLKVVVGFRVVLVDCSVVVVRLSVVG